MKNPLLPKQPFLLVAIHPQTTQTLFRVHRDYLIFINLVRELVNSHGHQIYGFSWLHSEAWLLIQPNSDRLLKQILSLLKRYHLWLKAETSPEYFKLRAMVLSTSEQQLDALRYVHGRATACGQVQDALDYHWHSYPIYNQFWQIDWLNTQEFLNYFSKNRILAMNAFREHTLRPCENDFTALLVQNNQPNFLDCSDLPKLAKTQLLAEPYQSYHAESPRLTMLIERIHSGFKVAFAELE